MDNNAKGNNREQYSYFREHYIAKNLLRFQLFEAVRLREITDPPQYSQSLEESICLNNRLFFPMNFTAALKSNNHRLFEPAQVVNPGPIPINSHLHRFGKISLHLSPFVSPEI